MGIQLNYLARIRIGKSHAEISNQLYVSSGNLSQGVT